MPITASSAQLSATPTKDGGPQAASANVSLSSVALTHTAIDISSTNLIAFTCIKFGAVVSETLTLQISVDGGTNFRDFKTYTFAQLSVANGAYVVETVKGTHARLTLANAQAGIGYTTRFFV